MRTARTRRTALMIAAVIAGLLTWPVLAVVLPDAPAARSFFNGNRLNPTCQSELAAEEGFCLGYAAGVADALVDVEYGRGESSFCLYAGTNPGQIRDLAIKTLADNPQDRHVSAAALIIRALREAFPCP